MKRDLSHGLQEIPQTDDASNYIEGRLICGGQGRTASDVEQSGSVVWVVALGLAFTAGLILGAVL